jgi:hypothetical protein
MLTLSEPNLGLADVNRVTSLGRHSKTNMAAERTCVNIRGRQVIDPFFNLAYTTAILNLMYINQG